MHDVAECVERLELAGSTALVADAAMIQQRAGARAARVPHHEPKRVESGGRLALTAADYRTQVASLSLPIWLCSPSTCSNSASTAQAGRCGLSRTVNVPAWVSAPNARLRS